MPRATDKFIDIEGVILRCRRLAPPVLEEGSPLVFLHDALGSIPQWKDFPEQLVAQCGLEGWLIERQGHGQSSPMKRKRTKDYLHQEALEVLPAVLQKLQISNPILIGHSDGGSIALLYASRFPTTAVITIAAHVIVEGQTLKGIRQTLQDKAFILPKLMKYHGSKAETLFDAWWQTWIAEDFVDWNLLNHMKHINCPVLAIQSDEDVFGSMKQAEQIVAHTNGQSLIVEGGGHAPHLKYTEEVVQVIKMFIKSVSKNL